MQAPWFTPEALREKVTAVSFVRSRRVRLIASIATAGMLLAGCGAGPGEPGAAAVVGDTRIPLTEVQAWYDDVLRKEGNLKQQLQDQGQMGELGRQLASFAVQEELTRQTAQREGVSVDERKVTQQIDQMGGPEKATAGKINTPENLRDSVRSQLLATELGRKYLDRTAITFDYTQASSRKDAKRLAENMARGKEEAAAFLKSEQAAGKQVALGETMRAADSGQVAASTPLFGAPPGTVVAFETQPQSGQWLVARINKRDTNATSGPPAQGSEQIYQAFGMRLLAATGERVGVELNPRYGVWDPVGMAAAPNENETVGFWFSGPQRSTSE